MKKDKTYSTDELIPNCLIRVHDGKVIQRTDNKKFTYLLGELGIKEKSL